MTEATSYDNDSLNDILVKEAGIVGGVTLDHTEEELKALYGDKRSFDVTISRTTTIKEFAKVTVDAYRPEDAGSIAWTSDGKEGKSYDWVESTRATLFDKIETIRELPNDQGQSSDLTIPKIKQFLEENGIKVFVMDGPTHLVPNHVPMSVVPARQFNLKATTNGARLMEIYKLVMDDPIVGLYKYYQDEGKIRMGMFADFQPEASIPTQSL